MTSFNVGRIEGGNSGRENCTCACACVAPSSGIGIGIGRGRGTGTGTGRGRGRGTGRAAGRGRGRGIGTGTGIGIGIDNTEEQIIVDLGEIFTTIPFNVTYNMGRDRHFFEFGLEAAFIRKSD